MGPKKKDKKGKKVEEVVIEESGKKLLFIYLPFKLVLIKQHLLSIK